MDNTNKEKMKCEAHGVMYGKDALHRAYGWSVRVACFVLLAVLSSCHTPFLLHRRQAVQPDHKPQEAVYITPVASIDVAPVEVEKKQATWQDKMCERLDALMNDTLLRTTQLGLCIYDLSDNRLLYDHNAHQRMRPASCEKVVTAVSALALLGPDYNYTPTVLSPGWGWCWDDAVAGISDFGAKGKRQSADLLYSESKERSLADVLMPMMKHSDNLLAESMFWQLPGQPLTKSLRLKDCQDKVDGVMRMAGLNPADYVIADGSGLSLYNYVSPYALAMLLRFAHSNEAIFTALYPTLPIMGVDGTLQSRMRGTKAEGNVRAKTGTVTGVSSLSGYVTAYNDHLLCFSIINQGVVKTAQGRTFQDKVCLIMASPVE